MVVLRNIYKNRKKEPEIQWDDSLNRSTKKDFDKRFLGTTEEKGVLKGIKKQDPIEELRRDSLTPQTNEIRFSEFSPTARTQDKTPLQSFQSSTGTSWRISKGASGNMPHGFGVKWKK